MSLPTFEIRDADHRCDECTRPIRYRALVVRRGGTMKVNHVACEIARLAWIETRRGVGGRWR